AQDLSAQMDLDATIAAERRETGPQRAPPRHPPHEGAGDEPVRDHDHHPEDQAAVERARLRYEEVEHQRDRQEEQQAEAELAPGRWSFVVHPASAAASSPGSLSVDGAASK